MPFGHRTARISMHRVRWLLALAAILTAGCPPPILTARFPDVSPPPDVKPGALKVALAPTADSRRDETAGWAPSGILIVAGSDFTNYIQLKFRNRLIDAGFDPIDASVPTNSTSPSAYKTILITLQSSDFGNTGSVVPSEVSSTDLAIQIYAAGDRTVVFASSYKGMRRENGTAGPLLAAAADGAIDRAFADQAFLAALR